MKFEYDVLSSDDIDDLCTKVNKEIQYGWVPQGGMTVSNGVFYQPIVHVPDKDNPSL